jgi:hypothetical protein
MRNESSAGSACRQASGANAAATKQNLIKERTIDLGSKGRVAVGQRHASLEETSRPIEKIDYFGFVLPNLHPIVV